MSSIENGIHGKRINLFSTINNTTFALLCRAQSRNNLDGQGANKEEATSQGEGDYSQTTHMLQVPINESQKYVQVGC